ncbi:MAG: SulP family inorganic anion transporter, partial [Flavisolibacter sp.]|nr:SulP family inorganic anion transporter [Flavisolibacter sp.]
MKLVNRKRKFYLLSFFKHDFKASITVFFVALPLCLGISLASGAPLYSGLLAGIIGGLVVSVISGSHLSISGPAAGL